LWQVRHRRKPSPECLEEGTFSELRPMRVPGQTRPTTAQRGASDEVEAVRRAICGRFASLPPRSTRGGSLLLPVRDAAAFLAYEADAPVLGCREPHSWEFWTSLGSPIGSAAPFQQAVLLLSWARRDAQTSQTGWRGLSPRRKGVARGFDEVMRHGGHASSGMGFSFPISKRSRIGRSCALRNAAGMHGG
jgi:hypothetical protein